MLESWQVVYLTADIADSAARLHASLKLKLPDAVQAASAITLNADALVMHDRDFSKLTALPDGGGTKHLLDGSMTRA